MLKPNLNRYHLESVYTNVLCMFVFFREWNRYQYSKWGLYPKVRSLRPEPYPVTPTVRRLPEISPATPPPGTRILATTTRELGCTQGGNDGCVTSAFIYKLVC